MKSILLAVMIVATSAKADGFRTFVFDGNVAVDIPSNLVVNFNRPDWFWARSRSETNSRSTGMNERGMSVAVGRRNPTYSVEEYRDATEEFLWQHDLKLEQTARQGYQRTKTDQIVTVPFVGVPFSSQINCNGTRAIFTKGIYEVSRLAVWPMRRESRVHFAYWHRLHYQARM